MEDNLSNTRENNSSAIICYLLKVEKNQRLAEI